MDQDTIERATLGRQNLVCAWIVAAMLLLILLGFSAADTLLRDEPQATAALPQPAIAAEHLKAARKDLADSPAPLRYAVGSRDD